MKLPAAVLGTLAAAVAGIGTACGSVDPGAPRSATPTAAPASPVAVGPKWQSEPRSNTAQGILDKFDGCPWCGQG